jgi:uncharacterized membrane protein YbhN (UPF0104 family)
MIKWLKNILAIAILALLLWYLAKHWEQLKALLKLRLSQLLLLYVLCLVQICCSAGVVQSLLAALKIKTRLWDMILLQNASVLLNYIPMKFGTLFRANYLKRRYGFSYTRFATFFLYLTFLITATASIVAIAVLLIVYGLANYENKILAVVFLGTFACSIVFLFAPLPTPTGTGKIKVTLQNFLSSRKQVTQNTRALLVSTVFLTINFLLTALRIGIIYHSIGQDINPAGCLILGALGFVTMFVAITPGALGVRELVLGSGAVVLAVPLEVGLLAAIIDRAVMLSFLFVVGGICVAWLWHKYPGDFKKPQTNASTEI